MKFRDLFTPVINSSNGQRAFILKARAFKRKKLTYEEVLEMTVPRPTKSSFGVKR